MRTKHLFLASTVVSAVAAAPLGCGSLDGHTGTPGTLATVQGQLLDPTQFGVQNDVRVAVVWLNVHGVGDTVSEDLPVQPVFPARFVVQFDGPPPAAALGEPQGVDVPIAVGVVVAYEDLNGNGKLDLVPSDAGAFIDRIVGTNEDLFLFYISGPVPTQATQGFVGMGSPGYNIVQRTFCHTMPGYSGSSGGSSSSGGGSGSSSGTEAGVTANDGAPGPDAPLPGCTPPPPEWLPMSHPYDLTVSSDPKVNQIMCQNGATGGSAASGSGTGWNVGTQGTPPGGYPSPTDPGLMCEGPANYSLQHCMTVQGGICGTTVTNCMGISVELGTASRPPGWPCP